MIRKSLVWPILIVYLSLVAAIVLLGSVMLSVLIALVAAYHVFMGGLNMISYLYSPESILELKRLIEGHGDNESK